MGGALQLHASVAPECEADFAIFCGALSLRIENHTYVHDLITPISACLSIRRRSYV